MKRFAAALLAAWLAGIAAPAFGTELDDARQLFRQGEMDKALERVEAALERSPDDTQARFLKGVVLAQLQRVDEALDVFRALTREHPDLPEPYNNLAVLYAARGEYDLARQALVQAIEAHPDYATAHENLGDIYAKLATSAYERSLALDDSNRAAREKLALVQDVFALGQQAPARTSPVPAPALPAAAPAVARAAPAATAASPADKTAILEAVNAWAAAWASQDVDAYLGHYVPQYTPPDGGTHEKWVAIRRLRLTKPSKIEVELIDPSVEMSGPDRATVTFRQRYRSDSYRDVVQKNLVLERLADGWKISSERSNP